jgi:hypothetical protein
MDGSGISQDAPFQPKIFESDQWVDVYQKLREDINDAFDKMKLTNPLPPRASKVVQVKHGISSADQRPALIPQLLKHRLQITVQKPNQAHFSIVDIPGFVSSKPPLQLGLFTYSFLVR